MSSRWSFALALCLGVLVFSHADADHHKKKNKDSGADLTQCTIVGPNDNFSCSGLKRVCQKMKNGQKCCGCVGDENAQAPAENQPPAEKKASLACLVECRHDCGFPGTVADNDRDPCINRCLPTCTLP